MDALRQKAQHASQMCSVEWSYQVEDAIQLFKKDLQVHMHIEVDHVQPCPVALAPHSEQYGLSLLHLLAQHCPFDRKDHYLQLLIDHAIDTMFPPIYRVLANDSCSLAEKPLTHIT